MSTSLFNINFNIGFRKTSAGRLSTAVPPLSNFSGIFRSFSVMGDCLSDGSFDENPAHFIANTTQQSNNYRSGSEPATISDNTSVFLFIPIADISQPHDGSPTPRRGTDIFGISLVVVVYSYLLYHNGVLA